ncbi:hypothetical protein HPB52_022870 [Rhipicephalus sanguineus]|uniref:Uncharacterized protein n=1 Tax=Rhipicephalus sanguineus TaxID=34632 RepID=A0A9D4YQT9_RHISA|nr:hypothetical protein HPB52_022870 [Rhipicephalus sanguineus]
MREQGMEILQLSFPKATKSVINQRKGRLLEKLESLEETFSSVEHTFHSLPVVTDAWHCQVLPNMNCEIRMDTNVVHIYEKNEDMVAEKPMSFSYASLPQFINDLDLISIMIADGPLKSSRYHWPSLEGIRPLRHLKGEPNKFQHLIPSLSCWEGATSNCRNMVAPQGSRLHLCGNARPVIASG